MFYAYKVEITYITDISSKNVNCNFNWINKKYLIVKIITVFRIQENNLSTQYSFSTVL